MIGDGRTQFCYQTIDSLRLIRESFQGRERAMALAIYQTLTAAAAVSWKVGGRGGFEEGRSALAEAAGVSRPTLDRYVKALEEIGLVSVERRRRGDENLPNLWTLLDAPGVGKQLTQGAKLVTQGGQANRPLSVDNEVEPPVSPPEGDPLFSAEPEHRIVDGYPPRPPRQYLGKRITTEEWMMACDVLRAFNDVASRVKGRKVEYSSEEYRKRIVKVIREFPALGLQDHIDIVEGALTDPEPWWRGDPHPGVVYGGKGTALFDQMRERGATARQDRERADAWAREQREAMG